MKNLLSNALMLSSALLLTNCNNNEVTPELPFIDPTVAEFYVGTQSPGDVWSWALDKGQGHMTASWDHGTFDDESDDISIEGTFDVLPSGFLKVTITKTEPVTSEIPTDGTAWFYAMEVPNMVMIIKPEGSIKGDLIAMVAEGDCAAVAGDYNYIITAPGNGETYDPVTEEAFGFVTLAQSGDAFEITGEKFSLDCISNVCSESGIITGLPKATCTSGGGVEIIEAGETRAQGQFANAGAMMLDFGYGNGGVLALKADNSATKEMLKDNSYVGLVYSPEENDNKTIPVVVNFAENNIGNMIGEATPYSDVETGALDTNNGALILVDNVSKGRVLGRMDFGGQQTDMAAALLVNGNDQILIISSTSVSNGTPPFIVVLAKQN